MFFLEYYEVRYTFVLFTLFIATATDFTNYQTKILKGTFKDFLEASGTWHRPELNDMILKN